MTFPSARTKLDRLIAVAIHLLGAEMTYSIEISIIFHTINLKASKKIIEANNVEHTTTREKSSRRTGLQRTDFLRIEDLICIFRLS